VNPIKILTFFHFDRTTHLSTIERVAVGNIGGKAGRDTVPLGKSVSCNTVADGDAQGREAGGALAHGHHKAVVSLLGNTSVGEMAHKKSGQDSGDKSTVSRRIETVAGSERQGADCTQCH